MDRFSGICGSPKQDRGLELTIAVQIGAKQFTLKEAGDVVYIIFSGKTYTLKMTKNGGLILN